MNYNFGVKPVLALCGGNGAGKSTLAHMLADAWAQQDDLFEGPHLPKVFSFADALKESLVAMLGCQRSLFFPTNEAERDRREAVNRNLADIFMDSEMSARKLMLDYGAAMREAFHNDVWTKIALARADDFFARHMAENPVVIFDDLRFPGEYEWLRVGYGAVFVGLHTDAELEADDSDQVQWGWRDSMKRDLDWYYQHTKDDTLRLMQAITRLMNNKFHLALPVPYK